MGIKVRYWEKITLALIQQTDLEEDEIEKIISIIDNILNEE